ncbi:GNAT family N-acetyltransferase [Fibrobacter succinogenes]|uniref:Acetyltransferase (GNAT) domain-containing protein n=1 Tax=Fibrobacter succinogenes TaxID=833 RepID=A0A380S493_FIBSU|nr:GNAT family N-acetyltransferase [Fibrobacter succinogenes]PWJ35391.1 acetyltransferase (GNAT) family protein [Fibrobacter succinogenes subsp. elongatus]SUQ24047.1 Acetyltransferase (GNAT) domain-containing protein [Fibrobacter succinogenes]
MVYPEVIHGMFVDLRSITLDDAEFSYNIRADKRNRDTVGQLAPSLEAQKDFIRWQMQEPNDYYFVVLNKKGERIGLYGVYDIHDGIAEVGREVNVGEPTEIMEVGLLVADFCRNILKLSRTCFVVYEENVHHLSDVKKKSTFVKRVVRSGREALYFEDNLNEVSSASRRIRQMLERLYKKRLTLTKG